MSLEIDFIVIIGGQTFYISSMPSKDTSHSGYVRVKDSVIRISDDASDGYARSVLLHEIIHSLSDTTLASSDEFTERQVQTFSRALLACMTDPRNREVWSWITGSEVLDLTPPPDVVE